MNQTAMRLFSMILILCLLLSACSTVESDAADLNRVIPLCGASGNEPAQITSGGGITMTDHGFVYMNIDREYKSSAQYDTEYRHFDFEWRA